ncbi:helix-turn-helix domain-containing protein [Jeongeupia naejangsanensis]|uniref:Helix-turn-helix transcriptional regulator n=1 Tax=Jeongeupia naejangsanensis TaxID=613195 RepID=A0ABS2BJS8_9NEIS|nr:AraC family transcriptional regulator [Jeongeupia naejangsanensis]MBM3115854.1 helix-turn-helix transcriptional regulator [Jeongeupia naejangsanensis]
MDTSPLWTAGIRHYLGPRLMAMAVHDGPPPPPGDVDRFAFCFVSAGSARVDIGGASQLVAAPTVLLLDEALRPTFDAARGLRCESVVFHPGVVNDAFEPAALRAGSYVGTAMQDADVLDPFISTSPLRRCVALSPALAGQTAATLTQMRTLLTHQDDVRWPCRARAAWIALLFGLRAAWEASDPAPLLPADARIARALQWVHDHYAESFTVDALARITGCNRTTLNEGFRAHTGNSVRAYVVALRMRAASQLLRDTLIPVGDVMAKVGYDNPSHFSRTFRTVTGLSPGAYRQRECWMN